ncbi:MAG: hypothetical protein JSR91_05130 [Proteobacteria bacterium]|nr:hypothetical protein [Pseudomonadota bacterium]
MDRPCAKAREPFGVFFPIAAVSMDEATEVARLHPGTRLGRLLRDGIGIRPVNFFEQPRPGAPWEEASAGGRTAMVFHAPVTPMTPGEG